MNKTEIATGVAVVAVTGAIVYSAKLGLTTLNIFGRKRSKVTANQAIAQQAITGAGGDPMSFIGGPAIYAANTPWLFGANVGNTIPPTSAGVTLPGAGEGDFLGFNTN
jgi:hypothetical protein